MLSILAETISSQPSGSLGWARVGGVLAHTVQLAKVCEGQVFDDTMFVHELCRYQAYA